MSDPQNRRQFMRTAGAGALAAALAPHARGDEPRQERTGPPPELIGPPAPEAELIGPPAPKAELIAPPTPAGNPPLFTWQKVVEDGRDVMAFGNPGDDQIKLIVQGRYAVLRSKKRDGEGFRREFINFDQDKVIELPFNTVIAYGGTNPNNPLKVIFQSNENQQMLQVRTEKDKATGEESPATYKLGEIDHTGANLMFLGADPKNSVVELDMTRGHGRWNANKVAPLLEFRNISPRIILTPAGAQHTAYLHKEKNVVQQASQVELIPADGQGNLSCLMVSLLPGRTFSTQICARDANRKLIATSEIPCDCPRKEGLYKLVTAFKQAVSGGQEVPAAISIGSDESHTLLPSANHEGISNAALFRRSEQLTLVSPEEYLGHQAHQPSSHRERYLKERAAEREPTLAA